MLDLVRLLAQVVLSVHLQENQLPVKLVSGLTAKQELVALVQLEIIALMDLVK
jgi:hypothetical protein